MARVKRTKKVVSLEAKTERRARAKAKRVKIRLAEETQKASEAARLARINFHPDVIAGKKTTGELSFS